MIMHALVGLLPQLSSYAVELLHMLLFLLRLSLLEMLESQ